MSWEFFNSETRKAIKPHKCTLCGKDIVPGERYTYYAGKWCGEFQQQYLHKTCENILYAYTTDSNEYEWSDNEITEWLYDLHCYDCEKRINDECVIDERTENVLHCPIIRKKYEKEED
ncbi:MAG: hypothetical protein IJT36_01740 [Alphaproteobacteria bacterium]|nr:hypothetical protein [Alphaproteobacteria bacterium]